MSESSFATSDTLPPVSTAAPSIDASVCCRHCCRQRNRRRRLLAVRGTRRHRPHRTGVVGVEQHACRAADGDLRAGDGRLGDLLQLVPGEAPASPALLPVATVSAPAPDSASASLRALPSARASATVESRCRRHRYRCPHGCRRTARPTRVSPDTAANVVSSIRLIDTAAEMPMPDLPCFALSLTLVFAVTAGLAVGAFVAGRAASRRP
jgi:hypothetical protein